MVDGVITVSRAAAAETGTRIGLRGGERFYAGQLLAATLMSSANDACRALADRIGGDETRFVEMMNGEARALGMRHTHFVNACGHDRQGHYSTAKDLAVLAQAAFANAAFEEITSRVSARISTIDGRRSFHLVNKNELVGRYPGAVGLKTGFTLKAGKCLIAIADRGGVRVTLILLDAKERWWSAVRVLDSAFSAAPPSGGGTYARP